MKKLLCLLLSLYLFYMLAVRKYDFRTAVTIYFIPYRNIIYYFAAFVKLFRLFKLRYELSYFRSGDFEVL